MLLARYLHLKKPPRLFARHYDAKRTDSTFRPESLVALRPPPFDFSNHVGHAVSGIKLHYAYTGDPMPFPAGTRGFLYYHPGSTKLAGQVRLRICDDASSFDAGRDLLLNGVQPWGPHLVNLVRNPYYTPLVDQLVQEGIVSVRTLEIMRERVAGTGWRPWANPLFALSDPFHVYLAHNQGLRLNVLTEKHHAIYILWHTFCTPNMAARTGKPSPSISPFTGSIKVRFELSKLPEHATLGPTLVLKVLEAHNVRQVREDITLIKKPVAGEYHYRFPYGRKTMYRLCIDKVAGGREAFGPLLNMPGIVYAE